MLWSPWKVALLGIGVWLAIRFLSPIEPMIELSTTALAYIVACYFAFFCGCIAWTSSVENNAAAAPASTVGQRGFAELPSLYFWAISAIGFVGVVTRLIDRVVVRGAGLTASIDEIRETLVEQETSGFGIIGAFLSPFSYLPLIILLSTRSDKPRVYKFIFATLLYVIPVLDAARQGSRSVMLVAAILGVFAIACSRFNGQLLKARLVIPTAIMAVVFVVASTAIFTARLSSFDRELRNAVFDSVFAQSIGPNEDARQGVQSPDPLVATYYENVLPNALYYTSGIYEFTRLWERPDEQRHSYGADFAYPYARTLATILRYEDVSDFFAKDEGLYYRVGVFTSLFGPLWVEWGHLSYLLMFIYGVIVSALSYWSRRGFLNVYPLYLYLLLIIFYAPVVNFMTIGFGFFSLNAFLAFALFISFTPAAELDGYARPATQ